MLITIDCTNVDVENVRTVCLVTEHQELYFELEATTNRRVINTGLKLVRKLESST